ncbi:SGNH hydrolase [Epithele typhae]|uniref:SGNH hydrolase n=1 Tax=Epithele typhae TaxID=378194 RepID=UPI002008402C|nr:SGNH hydrolase [Epithele typhae]KAH9924622.1 SGNH hydrolase [Epithele typhae]
MKLSAFSLLAALIAGAAAAPTQDAPLAKRATPKVYLAGDSTMAKGGGGSGTDGWGQYLQASLKNAVVVNDAIAGRSARSYMNEGRFQAIVDVVQPGDFVVIEFGHNDGGSLSTTDNGRTDCFGDSTQTCISPTTGETVYTFVFYEVQAGKALMAKGAKVIFSSQTPNNPWETGTFTYGANRFVGYAQTAAKAIGAMYVDHGQYVANEFQRRGAAAVDAFFPLDHTHTSVAGAQVVAAQFVKAVLCANDALAPSVVNSTSSIPGSCV